MRKILQHLQSMQSESDSDSDCDPTEFTSSDDEFYDSTEEVEIDMSHLKESNIIRLPSPMQSSKSQQTETSSSSLSSTTESSKKSSKSR